MNNQVDENSQGHLYIVSPRGYSAYEIAVQNGFEGTEEEWLASLKGDVGQQGIDGKSAYDVAVENGYTGTEEEWVDSFLNADNYYNKNEIDDDLTNQENKINKKAYYFNTVSDMKNADLKVGDCVITLGYYSANDGGGAEYRIANTADSNEWQETLASNLYATLVLKGSNINVRQFGIKETETGDISTKLQNIITFLNDKKNLIPYISLINIDTTLTIPMSAKIKINKINYTGTGYSVSLSQGIYGNIDINEVYTLTGSGVHINPTGTYSGNGYYKFNKISVNGHAVYFDNASTIVNSTFEGVQWYSRLDDCLVIQPKSSSVIGQCNFKVNNYYAVDHIGVVIDTTYGSLTNLDFGYSSVEGSTNGILLNIVNYTEGIKGFFRVNEVGSLANNVYVLKIKGDSTKIRNQIEFTFDSYRYDKIDLSEFVMTAYTSRSVPNVSIKGKCFNAVGESIGYTGRVMNNRLCMDYLNTPNPYNLTASIDLNFETSTSNPRISSYFTTNNLTQNITVTLPKSLKPGALCAIVNNTGHTVTIKPYGGTSGVNFATSAIFTTFINGSGAVEVVKLL